MANFVLVAGARLGGWAWDDVVPFLECFGHATYPLTLSGLAEKSEISAGQQTHVQDIVEHVTSLDLHDVVLVGHSYAGIPAGQAAGHIRERLRRVVFVDASIPVSGHSFASALPDGGASILESITMAGGVWPVPPPQHFTGQDLTSTQISRLLRGSTPHPGASLLEPAVLAVPLDRLPTTYIRCTLTGAPVSEELGRLIACERWQLITMETGHWPMFSQPRELARHLIGTLA